MGWNNLCCSIWECIGCCSRGWLALFLYGGYMRPAYQKANVQCAIHYTLCYCVFFTRGRHLLGGLFFSCIGKSHCHTDHNQHWSIKNGINDNKIFMNSMITSKNPLAALIMISPMPSAFGKGVKESMFFNVYIIMYNQQHRNGLLYETNLHIIII